MQSMSKDYDVCEPDANRKREPGCSRMPFATSSHAMSKVPAVTLGFWIIKILATTLGETAGDTVTMTMNLGYLTGTAIFLSAFIILAIFQIFARGSSAPRSIGPP